MSFIFKRKKFKFLVTFEVEELSLTPFVSGNLFAKIRLIHGGTFQEFTAREEIQNHQVQWKKKCTFECRISANNSTGELETCTCRVSARKELKGGKSYQKLGFADINLSEFAGAGYTSRRHLLEGYNTKSRQDNSMLKVNIHMKLQSGDPLFKVPQPKQMTLPGEMSRDLDLNPDDKGAISSSAESVASDSSGFGSLTRPKLEAEQASAKDSSKQASKQTKVTPVPEKKSEGPVAAAASTSAAEGHIRSASSTSGQSKASGYHSLGGIPANHSRTSSYDNSTHQTLQHMRSSSADGSHRLIASSVACRKTPELGSSIDDRLGSTRVDPDQIIENLLKDTDFHKDDSCDKHQLELYVGADGSTALGTQQLRDKAGKFERVVMDRR